MEILNKLSIKIPSDPFLPHENPVSSQFGQNVGLCLVNILVMAAKSGSKLQHVKSVEQEQKYLITLLRGWAGYNTPPILHGTTSCFIVLQMF